jgi:DNA-binding NarL/FixJ family response regulator
LSAKNSPLECRDPDQRVRVIVIGAIAINDLFGDECPFEVLQCEDAGEATRLLESPKASVVFTDVDRLTDGEREHLLKQMAQFNTVPVLAIADSLDHKACEDLLRMGFVGSLGRRGGHTTAVRAVHAVIAGELWFPRGMLSRVLRGFLLAQDPNRLTSREVEILELIGGDLNNQQVADKLFISRETVRWHIKSLHSKLGTTTRRELRDHVRLLNRLRSIPPERESAGQRQSRVVG